MHRRLFLQATILLLLALAVSQATAQQRYPGYGYPYGQQANPYQPYGRQASPYQPYGRQAPPYQPYAQPGQQPAYPYSRQTPRPAQPNRPRYPQQPTAPRQPSYQSQPPTPQAPAQPPPTRPRSQGNWPGTPPATGYSPPAAQSGSGTAPRLQVTVSERRPYLQQTIILTLEVISSSNLTTLQPKLPGSPGLIFGRLDGPVTLSRRRGDRTEIVNRYHYAVTPLRSGEISIPAIHVSGTQAGRSDRFEIAAPASTLLQVQPAVESVKPWLPLHGLILQSYLKGADKPAAGKPLTLVVDISAIGASGGQLPSFEQLLRNDDFHVYREKSEVEGRLSSDGRYLLGHRTETFTLVPQHGGKVQIPELKVDWWNVDTNRVETATVPIRQLVAAGEPGSLGGSIEALAIGAKDLLLWIPLIGLFAATIGFWILAWLRNKRFVQVVEEEIAILIRFSARRFHQFLVWLAPIRRLQRLRQLFVRSLPRSFRLWFCVRVVDGEDDPEVWAYMLKFLAHKHLGIPPQPLLELGRRLSEIHPRSDPRAMDALMQELDNALYGGGDIDFPDWKRRFRRQLRPSWLPAPRRAETTTWKPRRHLPELNPRTHA